MVAGMLMPLDRLRAIYEVLFREGVMVAKKDRRPRIPARRRSPHVQTMQGPLGCPPKRGPLPAEDPAREERQVYRRKEREEGAPETPVVSATTVGTLARPGPEPAPATDERDRVQKKTFTKWVNKHLIKAQRHISDLYEDLRDGHNLISLLEVLSGDSLFQIATVTEKGVEIEGPLSAQTNWDIAHMISGFE